MKHTEPKVEITRADTEREAMGEEVEVNEAPATVEEVVKVDVAAEEMQKTEIEDVQNVEEDAEAHNESADKLMLDVAGFSKKYKGNERYSAHNINFRVNAGEVVGLVGSNGAGKSTIIKSVIGVLPFTEGVIKVGGYDINKQSEQAKKLIGYVPDDHSVYEKLTGREYINYIGSLYGATKAQKEYAVGTLAEQFDIQYALDMQIASYSHGMKQKICILGALVHAPKLWILDEPMVGLDPQTMALLVKYIRNYADETHAVLFSSHSLETVKKACDIVIFIRKGELVKQIDMRANGEIDLEKEFMKINEVDDV